MRMIDNEWIHCRAVLIDMTAPTSTGALENVHEVFFPWNLRTDPKSSFQLPPWMQVLRSFSWDFHNCHTLVLHRSSATFTRPPNCLCSTMEFLVPIWASWKSSQRRPKNRVSESVHLSIESIDWFLSFLLTKNYQNVNSIHSFYRKNREEPSWDNHCHQGFSAGLRKSFGRQRTQVRGMGGKPVFWSVTAIPPTLQMVDDAEV